MLNTQAPYTAFRGLCAYESFFLCSKKVLRLIKFLRDDSHLDIPGLKGSNHDDFAWYRKAKPRTYIRMSLPLSQGPLDCSIQ